MYSVGAVTDQVRAVAAERPEGSVPMTRAVCRPGSRLPVVQLALHPASALSSTAHWKVVPGAIRPGLIVKVAVGPVVGEGARVGRYECHLTLGELTGLRIGDWVEHHVARCQGQREKR